jgi:hypothetical protein
MTKLRLITDRRTSEESGHAELRGLEDSDLFNYARLTTHLVVRNFKQAHSIHSIATAYQLKVCDDISDEKQMFLQTVWQVTGEHKKQTMFLFTAAVEILRTFPECSCFLFTHNGLKDLLHARTESAVGKKNQKHSIELQKHLQTWSQGKGVFTLDEAACLYLKQAGFQVPENNGKQTVDINHETLGKIHTAMTRRTEETQEAKVERPESPIKARKVK